MKLIYGKPGTGKTTKLIKLSAQKEATIVCLHEYRCQEVFEMAQKMGLKIPYPISFHSFKEREYFSKGIKGFLIDDADYLLRELSPVPILAVSFNNLNK